MKRMGKKRKNKIYVTVLSFIILLSVFLIIITVNGLLSPETRDEENGADTAELSETDVDELKNKNMTDVSQDSGEETSGEPEETEEKEISPGEEEAAEAEETGETDKADAASSGNADRGDADGSDVETANERDPAENEPEDRLPEIDIAGLSAEPLGWGQGVHFDELNRPVGSLSYQEKYGKYQAFFIADPEQVIYLTFDEGYEYGCTPQILDTLLEKNVKAVFFITLPYAKSHPELVRRMIDEGHRLGNHSVTHPSQGLPSQTVEQQREEVMGCHEYVKENFGYEMHLFRYPTGKFSEQSLAVVNNCNYKSVFWSFAYLDYDVNNQPDEEESLKKLVDRLHPGAIYLLHAESVTNTNILGRLIDQGREQGYSFELFR